jgi:hypothetical protein
MTQIVSDQSGRLYALGTHQAVLFASVSASSSGNNTLVAATAGSKIRVLNVVLIAASAVTVAFQSGAGGTALTGTMSLAANGGFAPGYDPHGHFETAAGSLLNLSLGSAVQVSGWIKYILVA